MEFYNERGWRAVTRNKFGAVIADAVVHQFGITTRHDISNNDSKPQRGWKVIRLQLFWRERMGKSRPADTSDTLFQLHPKDRRNGECARTHGRMVRKVFQSFGKTTMRAKRSKHHAGQRNAAFAGGRSSVTFLGSMDCHPNSANRPPVSPFPR